MSLLTANPTQTYKRQKKTNQQIHSASSSHQIIYNQVLITKQVTLTINNIGNNIKETLERKIAFQIEGKCNVEGYIKPNTVEIITFSSGLVKGEIVIFDVVFQCLVCSPVEGMHIKCIAKHINKAGIRAELKETPSPLVIFIARDHNYTSPLFSQVKENDEIKIRVIGQRFELNDKYICIIAELLESSNKEQYTEKTIKKPIIELNTMSEDEPDIEEDIINVVEPVMIEEEEEEIQPAPAQASALAPASAPAQAPAPAQASALAQASAVKASAPIKEKKTNKRMLYLKKNNNLSI